MQLTRARQGSALQRGDGVVRGLQAGRPVGRLDEPAERVGHRAAVPVVDGVGGGAGDALGTVRGARPCRTARRSCRGRAAPPRDVAPHAAVARAHVARLDAIADAERHGQVPVLDLQDVRGLHQVAGRLLLLLDGVAGVDRVARLEVDGAVHAAAVGDDVLHEDAAVARLALPAARDHVAEAQRVEDVLREADREPVPEPVPAVVVGQRVRVGLVLLADAVHLRAQLLVVELRDVALHEAVVVARPARLAGVVLGDRDALVLGVGEVPDLVRERMALALDVGVGLVERVEVVERDCRGSERRRSSGTPAGSSRTSRPSCRPRTRPRRSRAHSPSRPAWPRCPPPDGPSRRGSTRHSRGPRRRAACRARAGLREAGSCCAI